MNLSIGTMNFNVQEYQDITLNRKLGKVGHNQAQKNSKNPNVEPVEAQNDLFLTMFGQNQANLRMERYQKFQIQQARVAVVRRT